MDESGCPGTQALMGMPFGDWMQNTQWVPRRIDDPKVLTLQSAYCLVRLIHRHSSRDNEGGQLLVQVIAGGCEDHSLVLIANLGFFR